MTWGSHHAGLACQMRCSCLQRGCSNLFIWTLKWNQAVMPRTHAAHAVCLNQRAKNPKKISWKIAAQFLNELFPYLTFTTKWGSFTNTSISTSVIVPQHHLASMLWFLTWVFLSYLLSSTTGEVPFNHEILREANALCHRLPVLSTIKFKTDFYDVSKLCIPQHESFSPLNAWWYVSSVRSWLRLVLFLLLLW